MTPIFAAILANDRQSIETMLQSDANAISRGHDGDDVFIELVCHHLYKSDTPLHLAAAAHNVELVELLLTAGADVNAASNRRHSTPLHYAADGFIDSPHWNGERQVETIRLLLAAGAAIDARDKNGATALHRAVRTRCAGVVRCLLEAGSDPALPNKSGSTPFHLAVQNTGRGGSGGDAAIAAQRQIIETFLTHGVSTDLQDGNGKTVLECARSGWIRELLQ